MKKQKIINFICIVSVIFAIFYIKDTNHLIRFLILFNFFGAIYFDNEFKKNKENKSVIKNKK